MWIKFASLPIQFFFLRLLCICNFAIREFRIQVEVYQTQNLFSLSLKKMNVLDVKACATAYIFSFFDNSQTTATKTINYVFPLSMKCWFISHKKLRSSANIDSTFTKTSMLIFFLVGMKKVSKFSTKKLRGFDRHRIPEPHSNL